MYCPKCGMWNQPDAKHCTLCGRTLKARGLASLSPIRLFETLEELGERFTNWVWKIWEKLTGYGR